MSAVNNSSPVVTDAGELRLSKVLVSDELEDTCLDILRSNGIEIIRKTKISQQELIKEIRDYDGLIIRSRTQVTPEVIDAASNLKIIGRAGTGVDNINVEAANKKGITVINSPGGNTLSAAEHACTLILSITRNVARGTQFVRSNEWNKKNLLLGNEVHGKTLAIIGLGRIGREVAVRMQAFGMKTIGYDPILGAEESREFGVEWLPLEEIWPRADFITLHTPLMKETYHLINAEVLRQCRWGVRVINCARGGIVDEDALLEALQSGHCAGAGLDVFEQEPPNCEALINHPSVTCTPHIGACTAEAQKRVAEDIAREFAAFARGTVPQGVVRSS